MKDPTIPFFKLALIILAISFIIAFIFRNFSIFYFLAALSTSVASIIAVRNFPFLSLLFLPTFSINLKMLFENFMKQAEAKFLRLLPAIKITGMASLIILLYLSINYSFAGKLPQNKEKGIGLKFQSNNSADFFKQKNLQGPIFNNYDIGSYLIWHLYPKEKVFVDNRPEAYSKDFFSYTYLPMQTDEKKWQEINEKYGFNIIFFTQQEGTWWGQNFLSKRLIDPAWALIYADSQAIILIKAGAENQKIIEKYKITKENIKDKISELIDNPNGKIRMTSVNLLRLIGQDDLAFSVCEKITKEIPDEKRAWLEMGYIKSGTGKLEDLNSAVVYLKKAIELGENLPVVYNQLGLIYFNLGQYEQAKNAWQKALNINTKDEHAKSYLEQLKEFSLPKIP